MDGLLWYKVSFYVKAPDNLFEDQTSPSDGLARLVEWLTQDKQPCLVDDLVIIKDSA